VALTRHGGRVEGAATGESAIIARTEWATR
jgi:hypothetical protein